MNLKDIKETLKSKLFRRVGTATRKQLTTWENDGGYHRSYEYAVLINGRLYSGPIARIRASFAHAWKVVTTTFRR